MPLTIAMDGPVGAGKSSIADAVAARLGILHLDTGAMYRAAGLYLLRLGIPLTDEQAAAEAVAQAAISVRYLSDGQHTYLGDEDVTPLLRTEAVSMAASGTARIGSIRRQMVALQQAIARQTDMILDGRDIGTRVLTDAPVKLYITADPRERARRRFEQLKEKGIAANYEDVLADLEARDAQDMHRAVDPLRPAEDAVIVDTTSDSFEQAIERILQVIKEKTA